MQDVTSYVRKISVQMIPKIEVEVINQAIKHAATKYIPSNQNGHFRMSSFLYPDK